MKKNKDIIIFARKMVPDGGVEKYIYTQIQNMDKSKFNISVIIPDTKEDLYYVPKLKSLGCKIYQIRPFKSNPILFTIELSNIIKLHSNPIVHIHVSDGYHSIVGFLSKLRKNAKVIYHSHNASNVETITKKIMRPLFRLTGNYLLGVSEEAITFMFGKKALFSEKSLVVKNGIPSSNFKYNESLRVKLRKFEGINEDITVLGYVGRLSEEKNIFFLIDIMKKMPNNYVLIIIGDGLLKNKLDQYIYDNSLINVKMLGFKENVNEYMNVFDIFLLASHYESLGIVLIESQANGLPTLASFNLTRESQISPLINYIRLDLDLWRKAIENININCYRAEGITYLIDSGYDSSSSIKAVENIYDKLSLKKIDS